MDKADLIYTLDTRIISILFGVEDNEAVLAIYSELTDGVNIVLEETTKEYLKENGFSEEDVNMAVQAEDFSKLPLKFDPYIQNVIFKNKIEENTRLFLKTLYDPLLEKLSEEKKAELNTYLETGQQYLNTIHNEIKDGLLRMKKILEDNGVKSFDELREKYKDVDVSDMQTETVGADAQVASASVDAQANVAETNKPVESTTVQADAETVQVVDTPTEPVSNTQEAPKEAEGAKSDFDWTSLIMDKVQAGS